MRATILFAFFLAFVASLVGAVPSGGLNARRLSRGLGPLPPVRRTPTKARLAQRAEPSGTSQCNGGEIQCCNSVHSSKDAGMPGLLGLLGAVVDVTSIIGMNCSPLSAIGIGGNTCTKQQVCCTDNSFNGLVALGCTPINLSA